MTSATAVPIPVAGINASAWQRAFTVTNFLSIPAVLLLAVSEYLHLHFSFVFAPLIPFFAWLALALVVIVGFRTRNQKEIRAGYTTLWRANPIVPQLDAATGEVIREAGQPYVTRREWKSRADLNRREETNAGPTGKPTLGQRVLPTLTGNFLVFVVIVASSLFGSFSKAFGQILGLSVAAFLFLVFVVSYSVLAGLGGAALRRLADAAPGKFAFYFSSPPKLVDAVSAIVGDDAVVPAKPFGASADGAGLTFWGGNPAEAIGLLSWTRVTSIQADKVSAGNTWQPAILIAYKVEGGVIGAVELPYASTSRVRLRSMPEVRWIASELNALRTSTSIPRVI